MNLRHCAVLFGLITSALSLPAQNMVWDQNLQGYLIVMTPTLEKPAVTALRLLATNPAFTTKVLRSTNEFSSAQLHTDVQVLSVEGATEQSEPIVQCTGRITYLTEGPFSGKMRSMVGLPGTRMNISGLKKKGQSLRWAGRTLTPMDDGQAIVLITTNSIEMFNVASDEKEVRAACLANLRLLDEAKQKWIKEEKKQAGDTSFAIHIVEYLPAKQMLSCPGLGEYRFNAVGTAPICSIHGFKSERLIEATPKLSPEFERLPLNWPASSGELTGAMEVRVRNPNDFEVRVGLRSGGRGKDFVVPANGTRSALVSNGLYEIYFHYSSDPSGLYQGDNFVLKDNGVEIQIVKVVDGNYGIRKVK